MDPHHRPCGIDPPRAGSCWAPGTDQVTLHGGPGEGGERVGGSIAGRGAQVQKNRLAFFGAGAPTQDTKEALLAAISADTEVTETR